jgi:hypothetical protein
VNIQDERSWPFNHRDGCVRRCRQRCRRPGTRRPRVSSPARERKDQMRATISLRATNKNRDLMHGPTKISSNHPFGSAARVVPRQLREYLQILPWHRFAHVGVELGVPTESAGLMRPNASIVDPRFQRCAFFWSAHKM